MKKIIKKKTTLNWEIELNRIMEEKKIKIYQQLQYINPIHDIISTPHHSIPASPPPDNLLFNFPLCEARKTKEKGKFMKNNIIVHPTLTHSTHLIAPHCIWDCWRVQKRGWHRPPWHNPHHHLLYFRYVYERYPNKKKKKKNFILLFTRKKKKIFFFLLFSIFLFSFFLAHFSFFLLFHFPFSQKSRVISTKQAEDEYYDEMRWI